MEETIQTTELMASIGKTEIPEGEGGTGTDATNIDARKFGTDEGRSVPVLQVFTKFYTQVYLGQFPNSKGKAIHLSGLQVKRTKKGESHWHSTLLH